MNFNPLYIYITKSPTKSQKKEKKSTLDSNLVDDEGFSWISKNSTHHDES
jgi:hypothetical protein